MAFEVYSLGNANLMASILNGVAMMMQGDGGNFIAQIAGILGSGVALAYAAARMDITYMPKYLVYYTLMTGLLLVPKDTLIVRDTITGKSIPVKGLPWSFCFAVGNIGMASHALTKQFENAFRLPDDFSYARSGMIFGSKIVKDLQNIKITDANFQDNVNGFVNQCMVADLNRNRYDLEELKNTPDVWGFLSSRTGDSEAFPYLDPKTKKKKLVRCGDGLKLIGKDWDAIIDKTATTLARKYYGTSLSEETAKKKFFVNLDVANKLLLHASASQAGILKQKVVISALKHGFLKSTASRDSTAGVQAYAVELAKQQQKNQMSVTSAMSEDYLLMSKTVLEAVLWSLYPIMLLLCFMSLSGYKCLFGYMGTLLWMQSWPITFTVLNYIMTYTLVESSVSIAVGHGDLMNWSSSNELAALHEGVSVMAGYLMMSTAALSYALIKGGAGNFVHLAGHLGSALQSAAGSASSQLTSGGFNHGNASLDNHSANNTSMNKHDQSFSTRSGSASYQTGEGLMHTVQADGGKTLDASGIKNKMINNVNMDEAISSSLTSASNDELAASQNHNASYMKSEEQAYNDSITFAKQFVEAYDAGEGWTENVSQNDVDSMRQLVNDNESLTTGTDKSEGTGMVDNAKLYGALKADGGVIGAAIKKTLGASGVVEGSVSLGGDNSVKVDDKNSKSLAMMQGKEFQSNLDTASRLAKDTSFGQKESDVRTSANNLTNSHNESIRHQEMAEASLRNSKSLGKRADEVRSGKLGYNIDANADYIKYMESKYKGNELRTALGASGNVAAQKQYLDEFVNAATPSMTNYFKENGCTSNADINNAYQNWNKDIKQVDSTSFDDKYNAKKENLSKAPVAVSGNKLQEKVNTGITNSQNKIATGKQNTENKFVVKKKEVQASHDESTAVTLLKNTAKNSLGVLDTVGDVVRGSGRGVDGYKNMRTALKKEADSKITDKPSTEDMTIGANNKPVLPSKDGKG